MGAETMDRPVGVYRGDDPLVDLALPIAVRDAIAQAAYQSWRQAGYMTAPCGRRFSDRIHHPRPGDLVYVPDSFRRDEDTRRKGFGYLIAVRNEPVVGEVFYIQYGQSADDVCEWGNARLMVVPTDRLGRELERS